MRDLSRLKSTLLNSGLQTRDPSLFQVVNGLIDAVKEGQSETNSSVGSVGTTATILINRTFLTEDDETANLPSSRRLLAGTNITFNDTVDGERTIDASGGGGGGEWSVLTDGDVADPELIFADGDVITTFIPS